MRPNPLMATRIVISVAPGLDAHTYFVMAGLVPAIHVLR
jgi:hypothetical protein